MTAVQFTARQANFAVVLIEIHGGGMFLWFSVYMFEPELKRRKEKP